MTFRGGDLSGQIQANSCRNSPCENEGVPGSCSYRIRLKLTPEYKHTHPSKPKGLCIIRNKDLFQWTE